MEIVWLPQAEKGLDSIISYLEKNWGAKQILELELDIHQLLNRLSQFPESCPETKYRKNIRKGYPNKHTYLIYRFNPKKEIIEIINSRASRQRP